MNPSPAGGLVANRRRASGSKDGEALAATSNVGRREGVRIRS